MENASKALLIAGSILIVILLIAMGVKVFTSTQGTTDAVDLTMQSTEVAMFNNKFLPYMGENKNKNDAIALLNIVVANNATSNKKVEVDAKNISSAIYAIEGAINVISSLDSSQKLYIFVPVKGGLDANGYISKIQINKMK